MQIELWYLVVFLCCEFAREIFRFTKSSIYRQLKCRRWRWPLMSLRCQRNPCCIDTGVFDLIPKEEKTVAIIFFEHYDVCTEEVNFPKCLGTLPSEVLTWFKSKCPFGTQRRILLLIVMLWKRVSEYCWNCFWVQILDGFWWY